MEVAKPQKHIILVHGACHGAWSWFKVKPLLEASGHKVTTLDLTASGLNAKKIEEVYSLHDYTIPLLEALESLPPNEKVILVGHSLGGLNLALAMDKYPGKISVAVFLAAFIPDTDHLPSYVLNEYANRTPPEEWLDTQFQPYKTAGGEPLTSMFFGPKFLKLKLYQLCSAQDVELANMLVRPGSLFMEDLAKANNFSKGGFGSVKRVYIICNEDKGIPEEYQRWMIENSGVRDVMEIKDADHMAMLSKPQELLQCLLKITNKYD